MKQTNFSMLIVSFATAMAVFFAVPNEPAIWVSLALFLIVAAVLEYGGQRDAIVVQENGLGLKVMRRNGRNYEIDVMARFHGQDPANMENGMACAKGGGVVSKDLMVVAYRTHPRRLSVACKEVDLVILPFYEARYPCKALLLDEPKLTRGVPLQIISDGRKLRVKRAATRRLWQQ